MPRGLVRAYALMLPRLWAEESIDEVQRLGVGTGTLKADRRNALMRAWQRAAKVNRRRAARRKASPDELRRVGIGLEIVTAKDGTTKQP